MPVWKREKVQEMLSTLEFDAYKFTESEHLYTDSRRLATIAGVKDLITAKLVVESWYDTFSEMCARILRHSK